MPSVAFLTVESLHPMPPLVPRWLKILGVSATALVALAAIPILFLLMIFSPMDDLCGNSPLREEVSPDGKLKAVVFERNCGATTEFSTQVSLIDADRPLPNQGGNVFDATRDRGQAPAGAGGGPEVRVIWVNPGLLRIEHHPLARVLASWPRVRGVQIQYEVSLLDH